MARVEQDKCTRCGEVYSYVYDVTNWRRESVCDTCVKKAKDDKVASLKAELAMLTRSPILMLLAEVSTLRSRLIDKGLIDEVQHYKDVISAVKQMTEFIDGKADQEQRPAGTGRQDTPG